MRSGILNTIQSFSAEDIAEKRKEVLQPLIDYIQSKQRDNQEARLNYICTHNSRRSHLSQIWAQTMAHYHGIKDVFCYSGGTESTAVHPKIIEVIKKQGFQVQKLSESENPIYAVKYANSESPLICFSKTYDNKFNPDNSFVAIMTCDSANEACPIVPGAEERFLIEYHDPKLFDGTRLMDEKYTQTSLQIAQEMWYVFNKVGSKSI